MNNLILPVLIKPVVIIRLIGANFFSLWAGLTSIFLCLSCADQVDFSCFRVLVSLGTYFQFWKGFTLFKRKEKLPFRGNALEFYSRTIYMCTCMCVCIHIFIADILMVGITMVCAVYLLYIFNLHIASVPHIKLSLYSLAYTICLQRIPCG